MPAGLRINRDVQFDYMVECGVELGEITPLEAAVFMADTPAAQALSDALEGRSYAHDFMRNSARDYLGQLKRKDRLVWALKGLDGLEFALAALQGRMEHVLQLKVQSDLGLDRSRPAPWYTELASKLEGYEPDVRQFTTVHDVTPTKVLAFLEPTYDAVRRYIQEDLELAEEAIAWLKQPGARAEAREIAKRLFSSQPHHQAQLVLPTTKAVSRVLMAKKKRNQARGAIKKALALLTSFGMQKSVSMLVSGETVTLAHPDSPFKLEVAPLKGGWLEEKTVTMSGHVPFRLSLLTKEGEFLSRLCVLFDKTPVLDQLLSLSLFVQTGNEMELLTKANWFGYDDAARVRTILAEKSPTLVGKLPLAGVAPRGVLDPHLAHINAMSAHWAPFQAPVREWLNDWFGPAVHSLTVLKATAPVLNVD